MQEPEAEDAKERSCQQRHRERYCRRPQLAGRLACKAIYLARNDCPSNKSEEDYYERPAFPPSGQFQLLIMPADPG